jgi:hypothetical protein
MRAAFARPFVRTGKSVGQQQHLERRGHSPRPPPAAVRLAASDLQQPGRGIVGELLLRSRGSLHLEINALRHQLAVVHRSTRPRLRLTSADRALWAWLSQAWTGWRSAVVFVKPETTAADFVVDERPVARHAAGPASTGPREEPRGRSDILAERRHARDVHALTQAVRGMGCRAYLASGSG